MYQMLEMMNWGTDRVRHHILQFKKGIDEAYYMDTVMVLDGIYTGGVTINNKQISLIGESMTDTKLNVPIADRIFQY